MKNKKFLTESDRKAIISDKEKAIIESFAKTFNKIKRIDENEINRIDENIDDYEITTDNEIEGRPCVDFNPTELHPNDIIYRKLVDVANYRSNWYKDKNNIPSINDLSSYSKPVGFKVISNDGKILKLNEVPIMGIDENEIPKKFKPMDIVIWKPKKTRWNNDYSVRYGAKAKVIEVLGDMLKIEWLKDPSNLELVGRQMDGNYFTDDFEFAGTNNNDHEDWELEARKQEQGFNPEINPFEF